MCDILICLCFSAFIRCIVNYWDKDKQTQKTILAIIETKYVLFSLCDWCEWCHLVIIANENLCVWCEKQCMHHCVYAHIPPRVYNKNKYAKIAHSIVNCVVIFSRRFLFFIFVFMFSNINNNFVFVSFLLSSQSNTSIIIAFATYFPCDDFRLIREMDLHLDGFVVRSKLKKCMIKMAILWLTDWRPMTTTFPAIFYMLLWSGFAIVFTFKLTVFFFLCVDSNCWQLIH